MNRLVPVLVVCLALVVGLFVWLRRSPEPGDGPPPAAAQGSSQPASPAEALYAAHYKAYPLGDELVEGPMASTKWGAAGLKYRTGDYQTALRGFQSALEEGEMPAELLHFYLGQAHLALGAARPAVADLEKVVEGESPLRVEARWYLALALLKLGEHARAKEHLEHLIGSQAYNAEPAGVLLKQISEQL